MSTPPPDTPIDAAALVDDLGRLRLVDTDRLAAALAGFPGGGAAALADYLVARHLLTRFQADRAAAGRAASLFLGPYLLTGVLGPGSFGPLLRATDRAGDRAFALRVLPLRSLWQARVGRKVVRAVAAVPPHRAVVPLADIDSAAGVHYLAWPLAEVESLEHRVRRAGPLPPAAAARLLAEVAEGLAVCHRRGLAHGLLGPRTVGLAADGRPRVLEFGGGLLLADNLAAGESLFDTISTSVAVAGVLETAAPEWVAAPGEPTPAGDQYGLGCVAHFALTGKLPAGGEVSLAERSGVPPELAAAVARLLQPNPADRFAALDELLEVLADVSGAVPPVDPAEGSGGHGHDKDDLLPSRSRASGASSASMSASRSAGGGWADPGSGIDQPPPERDQSAASVTFDLPPAPPEPESAPPPAPAPRPVLRTVTRSAPLPVPPAMDTPRGTTLETQPAVGVRPGPHAPPPVAGPAPPADGADETGDGRRSLLLGGSQSFPPLPVPPAPVQWLPPGPAAGGGGRLPAPPPLPTAPPRPPSRADFEDAAASGSGTQSMLFRKLKKSVLFWQPTADDVAVSVYGPPTLTPGATARVEVYVHPPAAADAVRALARAARGTAELLGTARLATELARESAVAVHLAVANAGVLRSLATVTWRGRPERCAFDLHVPPESPAGPAAAVVSVGHNEVRIGAVEVAFRIAPPGG